MINGWWNEGGLAYFKLQTSRLVRAAAVTTRLKALVMDKNLDPEWANGGGATARVAESPPVVMSYGHLLTSHKAFSFPEAPRGQLIPRVHLRSQGTVLYSTAHFLTKYRSPEHVSMQVSYYFLLVPYYIGI